MAYNEAGHNVHTKTQSLNGKITTGSDDVPFIPDARKGLPSFGASLCLDQQQTARLSRKKAFE